MIVGGIKIVAVLFWLVTVISAVTKGVRYGYDVIEIGSSVIIYTIVLIFIVAIIVSIL